MAAKKPLSPQELIAAHASPRGHSTWDCLDERQRQYVRDLADELERTTQPISLNTLARGLGEQLLGRPLSDTALRTLLTRARETKTDGQSSARRKKTG